MNDFSKEELVLLACWSATRFDALGSYEANMEGTISLSHKIQNMIINYCEHDFEIDYSPYSLCKKCKVKR